MLSASLRPRPPTQVCVFGGGGVPRGTTVVSLIWAGPRHRPPAGPRGQPAEASLWAPCAAEGADRAL